MVTGAREIHETNVVSVCDVPSFADVIFDHISYICSSHRRYFCWGSLIWPFVSVTGA